MRSPETTSWHSASWQSRPAQQQPVYADAKALERIVAQLSRLPPIVVSWEIEALRARLAAAQRGEAFLLQAGDCADYFDPEVAGQLASLMARHEDSPDPLRREREKEAIAASRKRVKQFAVDFSETVERATALFLHQQSPSHCESSV